VVNGNLLLGSVDAAAAADHGLGAGAVVSVEGTLGVAAPPGRRS